MPRVSFYVNSAGICNAHSPSNPCLITSIAIVASGACESLLVGHLAGIGMCGPFCFPGDQGSYKPSALLSAGATSHHESSEEDKKSG